MAPGFTAARMSAGVGIIWFNSARSLALIEVVRANSAGARARGSTATMLWTMPSTKSATILPTISVVGWIVVRIISVTRFSFSSTVMLSIWFPSSRIAM